MKSTARIVVLTAALVAAISACSEEVDDTADSGVKVEVVCGSFAKESTVAAALKEVSGTDTFTQEGSEPDDTLTSLREADGKVESGEALGSPFCRLQSSADGEAILSINFREALTVDKADTDDEKHFTFYKTGESALASDRTASLYFRCQMADSDKSVIINGSLERENNVEVPEKKLSQDHIVLLNAAAHKVSAELGCKDPGLTSGSPTATSGHYA
ncbi:hypothetical protein JIX56_11700 [Streptomyces sp. CA-210063]|uniref:hypothetical protein n=1 Tax=Streptomyces sp. CA-210063 TaxID=2801029 RepID=UPI00214B7EA0|nr:hypothetical protein [Streptomyces sp. CA-210063]UUU30513.1 hypothetical protein JIX56_11700 [Streptomyces sp. CA-210063]